MGNAERLQRLGGMLHRLPVGLAAHDDANRVAGVGHALPPQAKSRETVLYTGARPHEAAKFSRLANPCHWFIDTGGVHPFLPGEAGEWRRGDRSRWRAVRRDSVVRPTGLPRLAWTNASRSWPESTRALSTQRRARRCVGCSRRTRRCTASSRTRARDRKSVV